MATQQDPPSIVAGYAEEERPLASYATLAGLYNLVFAIFLVLAKRRQQPLPDQVRTRDILLLGIATHKLSRLLAKDWVLSPLRAPFTRYQGPAVITAEVNEQPRGHGMQRALGELVT